MHPVRHLLLSALLLASNQAVAGQQTVILDVSGMTCSACPITVRKALEHVDGVTRARVTLATHQAVVSYDDRKTNAAALLDATFEAGYPSKVIRKQP